MMTKQWTHLVGLLLLSVGNGAFAVEIVNGNLSDPGQSLRDFMRRSGEERPGQPNLDPKRIINESNGFLKQREPEMTAEEFALYDKIVSMLGSNPEFALRLLEGLMNEKEQPSPAFELVLGNAYYGAGQLEKAESHYRSAVKRYPSFLRAWTNLGIFYYSGGRFSDAIPCFSQAVTLGDREPATLGLLGYSLEQKGNMVSAELAYMQALATDPSNIDWKEGLLRVLVRTRQYGRAEAVVKSLIDERPREVRFRTAYANILIADNRKPDALVVLEAASGLGIAGPDELTLLGDLYAELNLLPEASALYQKVFKSSPHVGEKKLLQLAQVLVGSGKLAEAEHTLGSLDVANVSVDTRLALLQTRADLRIMQQRWPEARRDLDDVLKLAPLNGRALLSLGRTFQAENDVARATIAYEAAMQIPNTTYRASLELANIELKNRHYAKCVEYLEKALNIERSDAVADYLARIKTLVEKDS